MHPTFDVLAEYDRRVADSLRAYEQRTKAAARPVDGRPHRFGRSLLAWLAL